MPRNNHISRFIPCYSNPLIITVLVIYLILISQYIGCTDEKNEDPIFTPTRIPSNSPIQQEITFRKIFGGKLSDHSYSVEQTSDNGFILCGSTKSFDATGMDVYLVKVDQYGNEIWTKTYGGIGYQDGLDVKQTNDFGYIITGSTNSGTSGYNILLIKTDINGNEEWSKKFNGFEGHSVQQTDDNGFIISGYIGQTDSGYNDVYLIKTNNEGIETWSRRFGSSHNDCGYSVHQTKDGGYVICGEWNYYYPYGESKIFLLKTDYAGYKEWINFFGDDFYNFGYSVKQLDCGGFIICGKEGNQGAVLIKTDDKGNTTWSHNFNRLFYDANYVNTTNDSGYIVCGSYALSNYSHAICILKTDNLGNEKWSRIFTENNKSLYGYSVSQTTDNGYILCGSISYESSDAILIKTGSDGNL